MFLDSQIVVSNRKFDIPPEINVLYCGVRVMLCKKKKKGFLKCSKIKLGDIVVHKKRLSALERENRRNIKCIIQSRVCLYLSIFPISKYNNLQNWFLILSSQTSDIHEMPVSCIVLHIDDCNTEEALHLYWDKPTSLDPAYKPILYSVKISGTNFSPNVNSNRWENFSL